MAKKFMLFLPSPLNPLFMYAFVPLAFLQLRTNGLVNYVYSQAITTNIECYSLKNTHNQPNLFPGRPAIRTQTS